MDVHVPQAITDQLRRRGVNVITAIEDGSAELPDNELLERTSTLGRVIFTQDIRFHTPT
jgi:predicted nuclease of predicted toxin-antitoxin system